MKESPLRGDVMYCLLLPRVQQNPLHPFGGVNTR